MGLGLLACVGCSQGFYVINETGEELENVDVHSEFPWDEVTVDSKIAGLGVGDERYFPLIMRCNGSRWNFR